MEVGPRRSPCGTLPADGLPPPHPLAWRDEDGRQVGVERAVAVPVDDHDLVPVAAPAAVVALHAAGDDARHDPAIPRPDGRAVGGSDVQALVEVAGPAP